MSDFIYCLKIELPSGKFIEKEVEIKSLDVSKAIDEILEESPKTRNWESVEWTKKPSAEPEAKQYALLDTDEEQQDA
jgi:hypothetical protein